MDPRLREALLEQARLLAEERGWTWVGEVSVLGEAYRGESVWVVRSNSVGRGTSVCVMIRRSDLAVVHSGFLPR